MVKKAIEKGICLICEKDFVAVNRFHKYCSAECRRKAEPYYQNRLEIKKRCSLCGEDFFTYKNSQKYCSNECQVNANRARKAKYSREHQTPFLKLRFQVFERDKFRCRYCGHGIEDGIKLVIDHIIPKAKSGQDVLTNYITACEECNSGKQDILLLANKNGQLPTFISI